MINLGFKSSEIFYCAVPLSDESRKVVSHFLPETLKQASSGRINEFLAGRFCAFKAASNLGMNLEELSIGEGRDPAWPGPLVGSISHTKSFAIAAVAMRSEVKSVGLDIERLIPEKRWENISKMVLTQSDQRILGAYEDTEHELVRTLIFSAKESLYKLLYPFCKCYIEFKEAKMTRVDLITGQFCLELTSSKVSLQKLTGEFEGRFVLKEQNVIAGIELLA